MRLGRTSWVQVLVALAFIVPIAFAQGPPGGQAPVGDLSLFEIFFVNITQRGPSPALPAQRATSNIASETAIQVRLTTMFTMTEYNRVAACDSKALDSFGTKPEIPPAFCENEVGDEQGTIIAYMVLNAYRDVFPEEAMNWAKYMVSTGSGLDPSADTSDESTPAGWGAKQGSRISDFFKNDGWNQLGNSTKKNYRLAFQDSGKPPYQPKNPPQTPEEELPYPLRWAPLTQSVDGHGRFKSQVHVVPHIATDVRPLVLTEEDFEERTVDGPYQEPDAEGRISKEDTVLLNGFIDNLFNISANLTPVQIAQGSFWDNKFTSSGAIGRHVERAKGLTGVKEAASRYGEALAQHDAVITAWKEKLRHDLVRPVTAVRRLRPGHTVVAYDPVINGPREVLADEWEPLILTQPHSEFPSASATLCTASFEFLKAFIIQETGDAAVPPFVRPFFPMDRNFKTTRVVLSVPLDSAAEQCGQSRLWAGLHFAPSVEAGNQLGTGIGLASLKHITSLINGEVPEVCYWCPDRR